MQHYPKHYYEPTQGCLVRQEDQQTLTYHFVNHGNLSFPPSNRRDAWVIRLTRQRGYCPECLLEGCMPIGKEQYERILEPCSIRPPSLNDPLPSWFSWPSRCRSWCILHSCCSRSRTLRKLQKLEADAARHEND